MTDQTQTKAANFDRFHIRKWYTHIEDTLSNETGQPADGAPVRKIMIAASIVNPYAGRFSRELDGIVERSPALGREFGRRIVEALGGQAVESYGKACVVGVDGEYEHGNAFLTSVFADPIREAIGGGKAWIASTGKRGGPGVSIDVPLAHKDELYVRSHYDTMTVQFSDGPNPDEIIVIFVVATRGRLHARLGGLAVPAANKG